VLVSVYGMSSFAYTSDLTNRELQVLQLVADWCERSFEVLEFENTHSIPLLTIQSLKFGCIFIIFVTFVVVQHTLLHTKMDLHDNIVCVL
jgi:hypothetical protein